MPTMVSLSLSDSLSPFFRRFHFPRHIKMMSMMSQKYSASIEIDGSPDPVFLTTWDPEVPRLMLVIQSHFQELQQCWDPSQAQQGNPQLVQHLTRCSWRSVELCRIFTAPEIDWTSEEMDFCIDHACSML